MSVDDERGDEGLADDAWADGEPQRWLDEPGDLELDLRAALEATQADFAGDAQLAAAEARLLGVIGAGGGGGGGPGASAPPAATAATAPTYAIPAALAAAGVIAAGVIALLWPREAAPPPPTPPPAPVASEPLTAPAPAELPPVAETPSPAPVPPPAAPATDPPPATRPLDEGALLERARRRVRTRPASAIRLLATHRARFPDGALAEEREALFVEALHARGRHDEARAALDRFRTRYPRSVHRVHLQSLFRE